MRRLPRHIEDVEVTGFGRHREVMVTLAWGWSYYRDEHSGVRGFDTLADAMRASARKRLHPCRCDECRAGLAAG